MSQLSLFDHASIARKNDPATSVEAAAKVEPKLGGLRAEFVRRLLELGQPSTANEIATGNESVRKRAKECVAMGFVSEMGTKRCSVTGQIAVVYWVV